jgi:hypothetical protein
MQKRLLLALGLSFMVLFIWQRFMLPPQVKTALPAVEHAATFTPAAEPTTPVGSENQPETAKLAEYNLDTSLRQITVIDQQASVKQAIFKKYKEYSFPLANSLFMGDGLVFNRQSTENKRVAYIYQDAQKRIWKEIDCSDTSYEIKLTITVENISAQPIKFAFPLALGTLNMQRPGLRGPMFEDASVSLPDKIEYPNIHKNSTFSPVNFVSLRDNYFCAIIEPQSKDYAATIKKIADKETVVGLQSPDFDILPGKKITQEFRLYIGPQDLNILK